MQKLKRIISIMVAMIMVASFISISASGAETSQVDTSVTQQRYELLKAIGVYTDVHEMHYFDELLTREQYASILSGFYGVTVEASESAVEGQTAYSDVPYDKWSAGSIFFLTDRGIMSGYTDGKFRPENPITVEQAVKGLVIALGYDAQAKHLGGYPKGYTNVAAQLGIIPYSGTYDNNITCGEFVNILYETLHTDMQTMTAYHNGALSYEVENGNMALGHFFNVYIKEGILNVHGGTALVGETPMDNGNVKVGGVKYLADTSFSEFMGKKVCLYYKQSDSMSVGKAVYMIEKRADSAIVVDAKNISDATTSSDFYYFNDNGKIRHVDLPDDVSVIYNGRLKLLYKAQDLMPGAGSVTLIDADNNKRVETVIVESYIDYWVANSGKAEDMFLITDKSGKNTVSIDEENDEVSVLKDGEEEALTSIARGDIVSIAADSEDDNGVKADSSFYKLLISSESVVGTVNSMSDDEIVINDKVYTLSRNFNDEIYPIKLGTNGVFYLNAFGEISCVAEETAEKYAFLINAGIVGGMDETVKVKLFNYEGKMLTAEFARNIKIDGYSYDDYSEALDMLELSSAEYRTNTAISLENSKGYEQLVYYRLNKDGKISSIDTIATNKGFSSPADEGIEFGLLLEASQASNVYYFTQGNTLWGKIVPTDNMIFFNIPADLDDEKNYSVSALSDLATGSSDTGAAKFTSNLAAFDMDEYFRTKVIVMAGSSYSEVYEKELDNMILVEKFVHTVDENRDTVKGVVGYRVKDGTKVTVTPAEEKTLTNAKIEPGDIMRWSSDSDGKAVVIEKTCSPLGEDDGTFLGATANGKHDFRFYTDFRITMGTAVALDSDAIRIHYSNSKLFAPSVDEVNHLDSLALVLVYNTSDGTISRGSIMDVKTEQDFGAGNGSMLFTYQQYSVLKTIVVYK